MKVSVTQLSDFATPWTVAHQAPLSLKFSRHKIQHSKNEDHGIWFHHFMANRWGNNGNSDRLFSWAAKSLQMMTAAVKLKDACSLEEKL